MAIRPVSPLVPSLGRHVPFYHDAQWAVPPVPCQPDAAQISALPSQSTDFTPRLLSSRVRPPPACAADLHPNFHEPRPPAPPSCCFRRILRGYAMQSLLRRVYLAGNHGAVGVKLLDSAASGVAQSGANLLSIKQLRLCSWIRPFGNSIISSDGVQANGFRLNTLSMRGLSTAGNAEVCVQEESSSSPAVEHPPRIKFKRPDKTARHIMNILNKEAVDNVRAEREIPDVQPGCIVQMRLQVPENKRRESTLKGIVIGRRNAGINTTFRLRRLVAGVGVESVFPLYSPNIKEIKILDRKKVRRAKLYYLRDRMNALKK
uniref:Ribosomal protein L19 n=1 Tax=Leersia perrieri TaxID=77586 RepID=A0A0D9VLQ3_9ORYZ